MLLTTNITDYIVDITNTNCSYVISLRPKAISPCSFRTTWVQFSQLLTSSTLNYLHNLGRRIRWLTRHHQVYVIRSNIQLHNGETVHLSTKTNHSFQSFFDVTNQFSSSVFGNKGKVIGNIIGSMCNKLKSHTYSLSVYQPFVFVLNRIPFLPVLRGRGFLE